MQLMSDAITAAPLNEQIRVPILLLADWNAGTVPVVAEGKIQDPEDLLTRAGLTT